MLTKRIIPCLDIAGGRVVKGVRFVELVDAGDPVAAALAYNQAGADELVFLDIAASHEARATLLELASRVADRLNIPFTVGGGVGSLAEAIALLRAGADKISINSAAVKNPNLIAELRDHFGAQAVVLAIDAKAVAGGFEVYINGGRVATGIDALTWAEKGAQLGAGEILLTSMDRDGTRAGFDLELTGAVAGVVGVPVIASGGAGSPEDFVRVFQATEAEAALAAGIFHFGEISIAEVKAALTAAGVPVRAAEEAA